MSWSQQFHVASAEDLRDAQPLEQLDGQALSQFLAARQFAIELVAAGTLQNGESFMVALSGHVSPSGVTDTESVSVAVSAVHYPVPVATSAPAV